MNESNGPNRRELPDEPSRLSDDELEDLTERINRGEVFIANREEPVNEAFGFVLGMVIADYPAEEVMSYFRNVGAVYEDMAAAGPRTTDGYPFFFSAQCLHRDDLDRVIEAIESDEPDVDSDTDLGDAVDE